MKSPNLYPVLLERLISRVFKENLTDVRVKVEVCDENHKYRVGSIVDGYPPQVFVFLLGFDSPKTKELTKEVKEFVRFYLLGMFGGPRQLSYDTFHLLVFGTNKKPQNPEIGMDV